MSVLKKSGQRVKVYHKEMVIVIKNNPEICFFPECGKEKPDTSQLCGGCGATPMTGNSTDEFEWNLESFGIYLSRNQKHIIIIVAIVIVLAGFLWLLSVVS